MSTANVRMSRRRFLSVGATAAGTVAIAAFAARLGAQEESRANTGAPMADDAYRPVRLPAAQGSTPVVTNAQRDELEHKLQCQCGCTLDVYTCRTTDFTCPVSPRMHADVMGLVAGGYDTNAILNAFKRVYGERVLMSPVKQGFNWVGYLLPFGAIGAGAVALFGMIRRWSHPEVDADGGAALAVSGTPEEMARLRHAVQTEE